MQAFKLLKDSKLEPKATAGATVYEIRGWDYGIASDDTQITGIPHTSVTLDPEGGPPSFTIPVSHLERIG